MELVSTPKLIQFVRGKVRDPASDRWIIPYQVYPARTFALPRPVSKEQIKQAVFHIEYNLKEKWLYSNPKFRKLCKYFQVTKAGKDKKVALVNDLNQASSDNVKQSDQKYVLKYIEDVFINPNTVYQILARLVRNTNLEWYSVIVNHTIIVDEVYVFLERIIQDIILNMYVQ